MSDPDTEIPAWGALWKKIIRGEGKVWVAFESGTCVVLAAPSDDPAGDARELLAEVGPVHVGTETADFGVVELLDGRGWVVTCHHPDVLTLVQKDEVSEAAPEHVIGVIGRAKRDRDAQALVVAHVEDPRNAS